MVWHPVEITLCYHLQGLAEKEFADKFFTDPRYCSLPPVAATQGLPNLFNGSNICPDSRGADSMRMAEDGQLTTWWHALV